MDGGTARDWLHYGLTTDTWVLQNELGFQKELNMKYVVKEQYRLQNSQQPWRDRYEM